MTQIANVWRVSLDGETGPSLQALDELLILEADLVDQFGVDNDALLQRNGPGLCVSLEIIDSHADVEMSEVPPLNFLTDFGRFGDQTSVPVNPGIVTKTDRVDDQGISVPLRRGIALPCGRRILWKRSGVREHL